MSNSTITLSDMNDTLNSLKQEGYIFFSVLIMWLLYKMKRIFMFCYHKVCPEEIAHILTEPEPGLRSTIRKSTLASVLAEPMSPRNSKINSRNVSDAEQEEADLYQIELRNRNIKI